MNRDNGFRKRHLHNAPTSRDSGGLHDVFHVGLKDLDPRDFDALPIGPVWTRLHSPLD